jgi:hypothetical protein
MGLSFVYLLWSTIAYQTRAHMLSGLRPTIPETQQQWPIGQGALLMLNRSPPSSWMP